jgi:hypothetical protein
MSQSHEGFRGSIVELLGYNGELSARSLSDPVRSPLQLVSLRFLSDFDSGYGFRYF